MRYFLHQGVLAHLDLNELEDQRDGCGELNAEGQICLCQN